MEYTFETHSSLFEARCLGLKQSEYGLAKHAKLVESKYMSRIIALVEALKAQDKEIFEARKVLCEKKLGSIVGFAEDAHPNPMGEEAAQKRVDEANIKLRNETSSKIEALKAQEAEILKARKVLCEKKLGPTVPGFAELPHPAPMGREKAQKIVNAANRKLIMKNFPKIGNSKVQDVHPNPMCKEKAQKIVDAANKELRGEPTSKVAKAGFFAGRCLSVIVKTESPVAITTQMSTVELKKLSGVQTPVLFAEAIDSRGAETPELETTGLVI